MKLMQPGHLVIDMGGHMRGLDRHFCDIMQADRAAIIGRPVLDITAPADRAECGEAIRLLCETGRSFQLSKRFIRDDLTLIWVTNTVSLMEGTEAGTMIVATIEPLAGGGDRQPALLLDSARFLRACKIDRAMVYDVSLFPDTVWDAILAAYIAEAEGSAIDVAMLADRLSITAERAARWIAIMIEQKMIEIEPRRSSAWSAKCFRLTGQTHRLFEAHLSRVSSLMHGSDDTHYGTAA